MVTVGARRQLRRTAAPAILLLIMVGCTPTPAALPLDESVTGLRAAGLRCGPAVQDNVPSGLEQWPCLGEVHGVRTVVAVEGDSRGVFRIAIQLLEDPTPEQAREILGVIVAASGAGRTAEAALMAWLDTGAAGTWEQGDTRASLEIEKGSYVLTIVPGPRRNVDDVF